MALKKLYQYSARDRSGIPVSGRVEAENTKTVSQSLKELGYIVVSIREEKGARLKFFEGLKNRFLNAGSGDVLLFLRQASAMINAGLPLLAALSNIIEQTRNPHFKKILINIAADIRGGKSLSEALSHYPRLFAAFQVNMVKAGETGGMLGEVLERLSVIGYEEQELKARVRSALAYPILLVSLSLVIVAALLTFVLPKFIAIFEESNVALPLSTRALLLISGILRSYWYLPLGGAIALFFFIRKRLKSEKGRYYIHKKVLSLPVFGRIILIISMSRFCKIMGALTKSGITLLNALAVSEGLLSNEVLSRAIAHIRQAVSGGATLADSMRVSGVFPPMMVQMVSVGENTGKLDEMFLEVGDFYDKESSIAIRTITTLIEPVLLLFMGLIVGFIALSVLLPIFNLVKVLKH